MMFNGPSMGRSGNRMRTMTKPTARAARKRAETRSRLIRAAHGLMSKNGVDVTTIAEITGRADVGFGTFYNYFASKDDLAAQVLDCVIDDLGRRNDAVTVPLKDRNPAAVQAISIRLVAREMMTNPMWKWWFRRPDLLVARMRLGFYRYGVRDLRRGIEAGRYDMAPGDVDMAWSLQMWLLVGGLRDMTDSPQSPFSETILIETIMRAMGLAPGRARELSRLELPDFPPPDIDFSFVSGAD